MAPEHRHAQGRQRPGRPRAAFRQRATDLAVGLAYVYAGRGYMALDPLLAAIAQLEVRASLHSLRQAYAATAFAYAQTGNSVQATVYLDRARSADGPGPLRGPQLRRSSAWTWPRAGWVIRRPRTGWCGRPRNTTGRAATPWPASACSAPPSTAPPRISSSWRTSPALRQGPLAELSRTVAVGSRKKDAAIMLEAAEPGRRLELDAVQARCAALAFDFAKAAGSERAAPAPHTPCSRALRIPCRPCPIMPRNKGPLLTERERQIATLAGNGVSNKDIALAIGISVRTVEGHLYQVFTKLGVSSRSDLLGLI